MDFSWPISWPSHQCVGSNCCVFSQASCDVDVDVVGVGIRQKADLAIIFCADSLRESPPASSPSKIVSLISKCRNKWVGIDDDENDDGDVADAVVNLDSAVVSSFPSSFSSSCNDDTIHDEFIRRFDR